jgi:MYXO-CTERM domain-containing protein
VQATKQAIMPFIFLDVRAEPEVFGSSSTNVLLIVTAVLALAALVAIFVWQKRRRKP